MRNLMNSTYLSPAPHMTAVVDTIASELQERDRVADFAYQIRKSLAEMQERSTSADFDYYTRKFKAGMLVDAIKNSARPDMAVGLLAAFVCFGRYQPGAVEEEPESLGRLLRHKYELLNGLEMERDTAITSYVMELLT